MLKDFDYEKLIGELSLQQKVKFYQILARHLTLSIRYVYSIKIDDKSKCQKMYGINEIQHRVISKLVILYQIKNVEDDIWSESNFAEMINLRATANTIEEQIEYSIKASYDECLGLNEKALF